MTRALSQHEVSHSSDPACGLKLTASVVSTWIDSQRNVVQSLYTKNAALHSSMIYDTLLNLLNSLSWALKHCSKRTVWNSPPSVYLLLWINAKLPLWGRSSQAGPATVKDMFQEPGKLLKQKQQTITLWDHNQAKRSLLWTKQPPHVMSLCKATNLSNHQSIPSPYPMNWTAPFLLTHCIMGLVSTYNPHGDLVGTRSPFRVLVLWVPWLANELVTSRQHLGIRLWRAIFIFCIRDGAMTRFIGCS